MPIVNISMYEGRTVDQKRKLATEVTDAICSSLGVAPQTVRIMIHDMPRENMAVAGVLNIDEKK